VVTLPKVTSVEQVEAMVTVCERLEEVYGIGAGELRFEIQVETPQSMVPGARVLPGLGYAPSPAAEPVRRRLRLLP
jgi:hypothetical protein